MKRFCQWIASWFSVPAPPPPLYIVRFPRGKSLNAEGEPICNGDYAQEQVEKILAAVPGAIVLKLPSCMDHNGNYVWDVEQE